MLGCSNLLGGIRWWYDLATRSLSRAPVDITFGMIMISVQFFLGETRIGFEVVALVQYLTNVFHGVKESVVTITLVLGNNFVARLLQNIIFRVSFIDVIEKDVCHGPRRDVDHALLCSKRRMVVGAMEIEPIK